MDIKKDDTPTEEIVDDMRIDEVHNGLVALLPPDVYFSPSVSIHRHASGTDLEHRVYIEAYNGVEASSCTGNSWAEVYNAIINKFKLREPPKANTKTMLRAVRGIDKIGGEK